MLMFAAWSLGVGCGRSDATDWQRCRGAPEADTGDEPTEEARLYCLPPPVAEGNGCLASDAISVDEVVQPVLGAPPGECYWDGEITCGPARHLADRCCYVVEHLIGECDSSADDR